MNGRLVLIGAGFVVVFAMIGLRLVELGLGSTAVPTAHAPRAVDQRADLLDRHGRVLATTVPAPRIVADPRLVRDAAAEAEALAGALERADVAALEARLASRRHYVVVEREASLTEVEAVRRLGLPAVRIEYRAARVYPNGRLGAHLIGYVDVDNKGIAGAERAFEQRLRAPDAAPVRLSLDLAVQAAATDVLADAVERYRAIAGAALVLDVRTGEIVAGVSLPDFDPHHPADFADAARKDRNVTQTFELGSVFKLFNIAMALDAGSARLGDRIDITRPLAIGGFRINDHRRRHDEVTVTQALMHSSNIANAKLALRAGADAQRAFIGAFGLDRPLALETGNVARPLVPGRWPDVTVATVAFGHGIAVTPLHLATGVAGLLGPGHAIEPTLLATDAPRTGEPVIDQQLVRTMRALAYLVAAEGSGQQALVDGYLIGGKTGTAEKVGPDGRYQDGIVRSSFVAAVPIDAPAYVFLVMLDEPKGEGDRPDLHYGSWTAAPTVGRLLARAGPLLGLERQTPEALRSIEATLRRLGGSAVEAAAGTARERADAAQPSRG